jgi:hypothetical protein
MLALLRSIRYEPAEAEEILDTTLKVFEMAASELVDETAQAPPSEESDLR